MYMCVYASGSHAVSVSCWNCNLHEMSPHLILYLPEWNEVIVNYTFY